MSTETKPPAGERETPEQVAAWCDEAARLIVEAINESVTFVIDYTSDDWRDKIAAIIAIHADSLTAERDELKRKLAHIGGVLREHEWSADYRTHDWEDVNYCPVCRSNKTHGHMPDCGLSKLLPPSTSKEQKK